VWPAFTARLLTPVLTDWLLGYLTRIFIYVEPRGRIVLNTGKTVEATVLYSGTCKEGTKRNMIYLSQNWDSNLVYSDYKDFQFTPWSLAGRYSHIVTTHNNRPLACLFTCQATYVIQHKNDHLMLSCSNLFSFLKRKNVGCLWLLLFLLWTSTSILKILVRKLRHGQPKVAHFHSQKSVTLQVMYVDL
jgi:hypothetical protein